MELLEFSKALLVLAFIATGGLAWVKWLVVVALLGGSLLARLVLGATF